MSAANKAFAIRAGARLIVGERGQDTVEYGLIIATIAIVVLLATTAFGSQVLPWFQQLAGHITTVGT